MLQINRKLNEFQSGSINLKSTSLKSTDWLLSFSVLCLLPPTFHLTTSALSNWRPACWKAPTIDGSWQKLPRLIVRAVLDEPNPIVVFNRKSVALGINEKRTGLICYKTMNLAVKRNPRPHCQTWRVIFAAGLNLRVRQILSYAIQLPTPDNC